MIQIEFINEDDKLLKLNENKDNYLLEIRYTQKGNFLIYSTEKPTPTLIEQYNDLLINHSNKISILEQNNQELREELKQIQTSIASLTSLITATLEEK